MCKNKINNKNIHPPFSGRNIHNRERLKSDLICHKVKLPPAESGTQVYLQVYKKHVGNKDNADFSMKTSRSSDEDEQEEENTGQDLDQDSDMMDLSSLTDDQLKCKLLEYGVKAGPIVATTRALYERKLSRMMTQHMHHSVNSKANAVKYSESEEDGEEEDSGSEQLGPECVAHTDLGTTPSTVGLNYHGKDTFYPQCFVPAVRQINGSQDKNHELSLERTRSSSLSFSITQLVEEIENRPQSKSAKNEKSCSQTPVASRAQQQLNKSKPNVSLYLTPEYSTLQKQTTTIKPASEAGTDVLMEMFPDTVMTPTGITATKRRSIKGAAGRPVQFKYPETPLSPATLEKREMQQRLVPLWVQIVVFLLVVALLYIIYISIEEPLENPFSALLQGLNQEPCSNDLAFVSQDQHT